MPDPVFLLDREDRVVIANEALCCLTKFSGDDISGKKLEELFRPGVCSVIKKFRQNGHPKEISVKGRDGNPIPYQVALLQKNFGEEGQMLFVFRDNSSFRQVEESLIESESLR